MGWWHDRWGRLLSSQSLGEVVDELDAFLGERGYLPVTLDPQADDLTFSVWAAQRPTMAVIELPLETDPSTLGPALLADFAAGLEHRELNGRFAWLEEAAFGTSYLEIDAEDGMVRWPEEPADEPCEWLRAALATHLDRRRGLLDDRGFVEELVARRFGELLRLRSRDPAEASRWASARRTYARVSYLDGSRAR